MQQTNLTKYHIVLLRHGESVGNAEGYHQGQSEFSLTEIGIAQAEALAKYWQREGMVFDQVIASPQLRARKTAEIIAASFGYEIEFNPLWMERDNGLYAGMRHDEAQEKLPHPEFVHIYERIGQTGESEWELFLRGGRAIQSLLYKPPGRYLVVSHGGLLNMTIRAALGIAVQANFQGSRFRFRNTAYASLIYHPNQHTWYVDGINQRPHWKDDV